MKKRSKKQSEKVDRVSMWESGENIDKKVERES